MFPAFFDLPYRSYRSIKERLKGWIDLISKREKVFMRIREDTVESYMIHISRESRIILTEGIIEILSEKFFMRSECLLELIDHVIVGHHSGILHDKTILATKSKYRTPHERSENFSECKKWFHDISPDMCNTSPVCISIESLIGREKWIRTEFLKCSSKISIYST